jgi:tetratricopeptide (TPR) repeat protein
LDKAIALDPQFANPYKNRGYAYNGKGDYDHAITDFDKAITLNPQYAVAYFFRGEAYDKTGQRERAIADLEKALQLGLKPKGVEPDFKQLAEALLAKLKK